ncbi:hypothetical protein R3P38DRAFT_2780174 [Favolaschia claudopus]|uniref:Uncharacterized protein n=1 Tax=Favolaschia claudopus TaxID=2862362 RepID=A0AAW0B8S7_9AGAR
MSNSSPLPPSSSIPTSPPGFSPAPPPSTQPGTAVPTKKALSFEFSSTAVVSGLPSAQKAHVLLEFFNRYMTSGHPQSPIRPTDDLEKKARLAAGYEIATQYFRAQYREAQEAAENADRKKNEDHWSDDSSDEEDDFNPPPPVFWFGGHPYRPDQEDLSVKESAAVVVEKIDAHIAEDLASGTQEVKDAWVSAGLPPIFSFVAAGDEIAVAAGDIVDGEPIERAWAEAAPYLYSGPQMGDARTATASTTSPSTTSATTAASSALPTASTAASTSTSSATSTSSGTPTEHILRLVSIFGWRDVRCGCADGKHAPHTRKEVCAFPAHDGTLVVRTMTTEVIPLN